MASVVWRMKARWICSTILINHVALLCVCVQIKAQWAFRNVRIALTHAHCSHYRLFINYYTHKSVESEMVCYRFSRYLNRFHFVQYAVRDIFEQKTAGMCDKTIQKSVSTLSLWATPPGSLPWTLYREKKKVPSRLALDEKSENVKNMTFCHFSSRKTSLLFIIFDSFFRLSRLNVFILILTYSKVAFFKLRFWERQKPFSLDENAKKKPQTYIQIVNGYRFNSKKFFSV